MRNVYNTTRPAQTPDLLDVLLKLSRTEREAVMREIKIANRMVDNVQIVYGVKDAQRSTGMLFMA